MAEQPDPSEASGCELTPGPSLQAERGAQILVFIPDYLVVFEYAARG
jgi:hypothetical protein